MSVPGSHPPNTPELDPRDIQHIECDCVPDLGPSHCHLCSVELGHPIAWDEAEQHHKEALS